MNLMEQSLEIYQKILTLPSDSRRPALKHLCLNDLFFLLTHVCGRKDAINPWVYDRVREVEANPNGYLDLWAREHYKSTIITFTQTIQDILNNPNITVGIFSHTKGIAKGFLNHIKAEFEKNDLLKLLFPDILYEKPSTQAPVWSLERGIVVKRSQNSNESTVEAHGLVDGQPTSKHYKLIVYDDVVTKESVSTPEQIKKIEKAWEDSLSLGSEGGVIRYIGTRWHFNDTYKTIMDREAAIPRVYAATKNNKRDGEPVLFSQEYLDSKKKQGLYTFACQYLLNPVAEDLQNFKPPWLRFWGTKEGWKHFNRYILIDPANMKSKKSDYTAIWVIGYGNDDNYYIIDAYRDRLNLTERTELLFKLHRMYKPRQVGYERYGKDTDIEHIQYVMKAEQYRFEITPLGGIVNKYDRIRKLVPLFENSRIYLPYEHEILHFDYEGKAYDPIERFIEDEYKAFPVCIHDDMLDALARITSPEMRFKSPLSKENIGKGKKRFTADYKIFGNGRGL